MSVSATSRPEASPIAGDKPDPDARRPCCSAEGAVIRWALERLAAPPPRDDRET